MTTATIACAHCLAEDVEPPYLLPGALITAETAAEGRAHITAAHFDARRLPIRMSNEDDPDRWTFRALQPTPKEKP